MPDPLNDRLTTDPAPSGAEPPLERAPEKPLLLVDIDGVISLFGFRPGEQPAGSFHTIEGIPHFLSSTAPPHLLELSALFDLVWASGWEEKADEHLPRLLGLPRGLPFLHFERRSTVAGGSLAAHWKLQAIDHYAQGRELAWIDDAFNDACHAWATQRSARTARTLLVPTRPERGLTSVEAELLRRWACEGLGVSL